MNDLDLMILDEILKQGKNILGINIYEFAKESNVSASKVTKTCQKLGFTGYKQLRYTVRDLDNISYDTAFVLLLKLEKMKNELLQMESKRVDFELLNDKYKIFYEMLCNAQSGEKSELMKKLIYTLTIILNYYSCLSSNEDQEYYINFYNLILQEIKFCLQ